MAQVSHTEPCPKCRERGNDKRRDNLVCYADGGAHCFACGYHVHPPLSIFSFKEHNEVRAKEQAIIPHDAEKEIPEEPSRWLAGYGLPKESWGEIIFWSPGEKRLYFVCGTPPAFSIGRTFELGEKRKWFVKGQSHDAPVIFGNTEGRSIILVEDLLSAKKVSSVLPAIPLFGTNIFDGVYPVLQLYKKPVVLWLDKDQAAMMPKRSFSLQIVTGLPVHYIVTDEDPKSYSEKQIREFLKEHT